MTRKLFKLTELKVKHLQKMARIRLASKETLRLRKQLLATLKLVNLLSQLDTTEVSPLTQVTGVENSFREDKTALSLTARKALSGASNQYNDFFRIKPIF